MFTQYDHVSFLPFFFVDLYAKVYFFICICLFCFLIFCIVTSKFLIFEHGFRSVLYWIAQVLKGHSSSKDFLNCSPFCVFQTWIEIFNNLDTQNYSSVSGLPYGLLITWSVNSLSLEIFHYCSLWFDYFSKFKCWFLF